MLPQRRRTKEAAPEPVAAPTCRRPDRKRPRSRRMFMRRQRQVVSPAPAATRTVLSKLARHVPLGDLVAAVRISLRCAGRFGRRGWCWAERRSGWWCGTATLAGPAGTKGSNDQTRDPPHPVPGAKAGLQHFERGLDVLADIADLRDKGFAPENYTQLDRTIRRRLVRGYDPEAVERYVAQLPREADAWGARRVV